MNIKREVIVFLYFVLEGIVGGILMDILRAFRHNKQVKDIVVYLEDILYWIILGCGVIWLSYTLNTGTIRMYMILGMFLGLLIYFLTLTMFVYKVFDVICRYSVRLFGWFIKIFRRPADEKEGKLA